MHILSLESISKTYGLKPLFEGVSLGLDSEDRIGVVGANGSGKTTLLRLIARQLNADSGQIVFAAGVSIGYLRRTRHSSRIRPFSKQPLPQVMLA